nr:MAG TPA: hypothetical protein [Caudoviricetes sp.]
MSPLSTYLLLNMWTIRVIYLQLKLQVCITHLINPNTRF